jgi:hypothetical protein
MMMKILTYFSISASHLTGNSLLMIISVLFVKEIKLSFSLVDMRWPTVIIQVNSLDEWDRYRIEGYGFFELPKEAGHHTIKVKTWKPVQSVENQVHTFFLGTLFLKSFLNYFRRSY